MSLPERPPGVHWISLSTSAKILGVDSGLLKALAYRHQIIGYTMTTKRGNHRVVLDADDVRRMEAKLKQQPDPML